MRNRKRASFFKSLRFRILIILIILGIVPSVIVVGTVISNYEDKAVDNRSITVRNQCDILSNLLIQENYLNDSSSQVVNSKLELLSNSYNGRIILIDRNFKVIKDTFGVDEGKILVSPLIVKCFKGEEPENYNRESQILELAIPIKSPDVKQLQGAMLVSVSTSEIGATIDDLDQNGILIVGIIVALSVLLAYVLSTVLVKPFARVTKSI